MAHLRGGQGTQRVSRIWFTGLGLAGLRVRLGNDHVTTGQLASLDSHLICDRPSAAADRNHLVDNLSRHCASELVDSPGVSLCQSGNDRAVPQQLETVCTG